MDKLQQSAVEAMLGVATSEKARQRIQKTVQSIIGPGYQRISVARRAVSEKADAHVVRIIDPKMINERNVQELGIELQFLIRTNPGGDFQISFADVNTIASDVLAKLVAAHKTAMAWSGRLTLTSVNPHLYEVFKTTKLDGLFDVREDESVDMAAI